MPTAHTRRRTTAVITGATAALVAALLVTPAIAHATAGRAATPAASPQAAIRLADQLGTRSAGAYRDATGRMVVNVTDDAAAAQVRAAGAEAKLVSRNSAALTHAVKTLDDTARVPGTSWGVDPATDQVVVSIDPTVTGADLAKVDAAIARLGDAVRVTHLTGAIHLDTMGGDAIYGGAMSCSLGFNVHSGSTYYFLTAGHCANQSNNWYADAAHTVRLGKRIASTFPDKDYALVKYDAGVAHPGTVDLYGTTVNVVSGGGTYVGMAATRSGAATGVHSGAITGMYQTVNYADGTVYGMIKTDICAEPGDSGGALLGYDTRTVPQGLTSGSSGDCTTGGESYYQPIVDALSAYGVELVYEP